MEVDARRVHLHHVFNGACNNWGDYVDDTPPQAVAIPWLPRRPGQPQGAGARLDPQLHGLVRRCYNQFTKGQVQRMQDAWLYYRA